MPKLEISFGQRRDGMTINGRLKHIFKDKGDWTIKQWFYDRGHKGIGAALGQGIPFGITPIICHSLLIPWRSENDFSTVQYSTHAFIAIDGRTSSGKELLF